MSKFAIIPAAGKPTNQILAHTNLPDTMLPINGKPVIGYIIDDLLSRGFTNAIVVLNPNDTHTEKYTKKNFGKKINLSVVYNDNLERGIGYSIFKAIPSLVDAESVTIYLGDTIYKGPLDFAKDFLITTKQFETSNKWCFIERSHSGDRYIDKPTEYTGDGLVLAGLYHFTDVALFISTLTEVTEQFEKIELSKILEHYGKSRTFTLVDACDYYDCGNIENYYRAKIDFLKLRSFNTVSYNDLFGTITKSSQKLQKLEDEINWYKNIPEEIKVFSPRLIDYRINPSSASYTLEYYGYQSLADYFVFNHFSDKVWQLVIDRLFEIATLFSKYETVLPFAFFDEMYRVKTLERVSMLRTQSDWAYLLDQETVTINNQEYRGWPYFETKLVSITQDLFQSSKPTFIHGDLCLSNILFDPNNRIFKLIDPRGNFGTTSVYGDHNYDIAKLRHSFSGWYDLVMSDLFQIEEVGTAYNFSIFSEPEHEKISSYFDTALEKNGYDLRIVQLIESLLFISMIPLHSDAPQRQKAMFFTSIKLLNNLKI